MAKTPADPDPEDLFPPGGDPPTGPRRITCEFCGCSLAASGEVLRRSSEAKAYIAQAEAIETQTRELDDLRSRVTEIEAELAAAVARAESAERASKGISW